MSSKIIEVALSKPLQNTPAKLEQAIITAWEQADSLLSQTPFKVESLSNKKLDTYSLSMDLQEVRGFLATAHAYDGGFTRYQQTLRQSATNIKQPVIKIELTAEAAPENTIAYYHAAAVALQQLYLVMNIAVPGSCQFIDAKCLGDEALCFDPPSLDATPFMDAYLYSSNTQWPNLSHMEVAQVWHWLDQLKTSQTETAILAINRVMFGLLELGYSQFGLSDRDANLIYGLLELLTSTEPGKNYTLLRKRTALILGDINDDGQFAHALYQLKKQHNKGERPFRRQALKVHDYSEERLRHLRIHNSPVEEGLAVIVATLQQLCTHLGSGYRFNENVSTEPIISVR
jgi:hypothetical protein